MNYKLKYKKYKKKYKNIKYNIDKLGGMIKSVSILV